MLELRFFFVGVFVTDVANGNFTLDSFPVNDISPNEVFEGKEKFPYYQHPEIPGN